MTQYHGSCHCGAIQFSVNIGDIKDLIQCNCSMCKRAGWSLTFVPSTQFTLEAGKDKLTDYQFAKKNMHHTFCSICGVHPFTEGPGHDGNSTYAINTHCLTDFDASGIEIKFFDGASL